jgi:hypothetical protein
MQQDYAIQLAGKGLLARFVTKHAPPDDGSKAAPKECEAQQRGFRNPPMTGFCTKLVKPEQHERPTVDQGERGKRER